MIKILMRFIYLKKLKLKKLRLNIEKKIKIIVKNGNLIN